VNIFLIASKSFRNSLVWFAGIAAVNKVMYIDIFSHLSDMPPKMENQRFLPLVNAAAHRSVLVRDFVAENNVTTLENPPYSSDQTPADFYLFSLKGRRFCDATDIIKNATEELRGLS
jgi:hypothetical protein